MNTSTSTSPFTNRVDPVFKDIHEKVHLISSSEPVAILMHSPSGLMVYYRVPRLNLEFGPFNSVVEMEQWMKNRAPDYFTSVYETSTRRYGV